MEKFLLIAHREKEKTCRIALNLTTHIEETGELEWKKSSFEDILVFQNEEIWKATFFKGPLEQ